MENGPMTFKKFFNIVKSASPSDADPWNVTVEPSKYLQKLDPQRAIVELTEFINARRDELRQYSEEDLQEDEVLKALEKLVFELETAENCVAFLREEHGTVH